MTPIEELIETEAIKKVRSLYSHYFDMDMPDKMAELFTEDAVCEFGEAYGGDWVGRQQIRDNYAGIHGNDQTQFKFMHATTNPWIELTGPDSAKGRFYLLDLNLSPEVANPLMLIGVYDDIYKKVDGRWMIHRTRIDFIWPRRDYNGLRA